MIKIVTNYRASLLQYGEFPYCKCKQESELQENWHCEFVDRIYYRQSTNEVAELFKHYELHDVNGWYGLNKFGIDDSIKDHFEFDGDYSVQPIMVCIKTDDEFEHQIYLPRVDLFSGFKDDVNLGIGIAILNTDDDNVKIIAECTVKYPK